MKFATIVKDIDGVLRVSAIKADGKTSALPGTLAGESRYPALDEVIRILEREGYAPVKPLPGAKDLIGGQTLLGFDQPSAPTETQRLVAAVTGQSLAEPKQTPSEHEQQAVKMALARLRYNIRNS